MNFHALLIIFGQTYYLSAPQCHFLFSAIFVFQIFRLLKVLQKFQKNQIKNQRVGTFRDHLGGARGPPPGTQAPWWHALGAGRARGAPGPLVAPLAAPFAYIFPPRRKSLIYKSFPDLPSVPPPPFQDWGCQETLPQHPVGRRNHLREPLHLHG